MKRAADRRGGPPPKRGRLRRILSLRRIVRGVGAIVLVMVLGPALFIFLKCGGGAAPRSVVPEAARDVPGYARPEARTYLTVPAWYIAYNTEEYAAFIGRQPASRFPYLGSVRDYWGYYGDVCAVTRREYPFDTGSHVMLGVIGASFTAENLLKGLYENTIGRLSEWIGAHDSEEDAFAFRTAQEYGQFMHTIPWYEFPFGTKLVALWKETPKRGGHPIRKWERRLALSFEYAAKAAYGWLVGLATQAAFDPKEPRIHATVTNVPDAAFSDPGVQRVKRTARGAYIVALPRDEEFTRAALKLLAQGVHFVDIAGNYEILVTAIVPRDWQYQLNEGAFVFDRALITDSRSRRIGIRAPVASLGAVVEHLGTRAGRVEHLYDY